MYRQGVGDFKYFVGISSLSQVANREDRVCVLNILGGESSEVTPVGHVYSGGNVVFGTSPGRRGQVLETALGPIPVFNNVREGLEAGHRFNSGVVYLPPQAARDGVAELIRVNPDLRKIFIVTEKLSVHDAREIRAMGQQNGIDIFGGNSLGVADSWGRVRIGGALGGDAPNEALKKGSIAIFSNSGNFTTTIATYLRMAGWGTTTLISSGKDVYIHFAAPEFAFALANDARSKAAVLYVEPGGSYEQDAHFTKPVVACVVGRWKAKLTRAVGHAGAMAGGDDDATAKERWFMDKFGVSGIFTPEQPIFSAKGALVTNIAHIPQALTAVMRENATRPDFAPEGSLSLKPWFGSSQGLSLPPAVDLPVVTAITPYDEQIAALNRRVGAGFPRQSMKDVSGASQMAPSTQITSLHGLTVLDAADLSFESNLCLALLREPASENQAALISVAVGAAVNLLGDPALAAAEAARQADNAPNAAMAAALSIIGPGRVAKTRQALAALIDLFAGQAAVDPGRLKVDGETRRLFIGDRPDPRAEAMLAALGERGAGSPFVDFLRSLKGPPTHHAVEAAIAAGLVWGPLMRKRISRITAELLPWWLHLVATAIGSAADAICHGAGSFCGVPMRDILGRQSLTETACLALLGGMPGPGDLINFQNLVGLLLSNGPGTISAQGAKGAVSADGPETPGRVQINKAMVGFLSHCGFAHGGNGFEAIAFLLERFRDSGLTDPGDPAHGLDLQALAAAYVSAYASQKSRRKAGGSLDTVKIPGVNHPVFKGRAVNFDPREVYVRDLLKQRGEYNVFVEFYQVLVRTLFDAGVSRNVYCVNIDAVIAALLLKMLWPAWRDGSLAEGAIERAAFTMFLFSRMLGCAAEIDDHLNRGKDMDTRSPASQCRFVA